ncbi:MAG: ATP-binding protein [Candidatus Zixiibacteriota bacterium]
MNNLRVLFVDDSENDALLLKQLIERAGYTVEYKVVAQSETMEHALLSRPWDVILCDYNMPNFTLCEALQLARQTDVDIPFIVVSGSIGEDLAVQAMKSGAHDYVMKDRPKRLVAAIEREVHEAGERRARKAAEERLRASERLRSIGEASASVLHDLKNPLQVISNCAELLSVKYSSDPTGAKFLGIIEDEVQRMVAMTKEILDYARGNVELALGQVDLSHLLQEFVDKHTFLLERDKIGLVYRENIAPLASPVFTLDRQKIVRAVTNILDNAKSISQSGEKIRLLLTVTEESAFIRIEDSGPGIPAEIRDTLFDPFVTVGKAHGTGLGLCITRSIVEAHGGRISVESAIGEGTSFTLSFPRNWTKPSVQIEQQVAELVGVD